VFNKGDKIVLRVSSSDTEEAGTFFEKLTQGHALQQRPSWVSIHHDADHPSSISLPITSGNRIGTFLSGGIGAKQVERTPSNPASHLPADDW
jgi:hypothetical protein